MAARSACSSTCSPSTIALPISTSARVILGTPPSAVKTARLACTESIPLIVTRIRIGE